ncbi:MAG: septum formation initiator family protein [Ruminococcus sp.]|nr:septum formation initiator family protein [Candidatus Copronaster equi]
MAKKAENKRKFSFIACFLVIALCSYFIISVVTVRHQINEVEAQISDVKQKSAEQLAENRKIEKAIAGENTDEYVKKVARDNGYIIPGERVYYDVSVND